MSNQDYVKSTLTDWLLGMILVAFDFSAGFRLRFERPGASDKPQVLYLEIKSKMLIGNVNKWQEFVQSLPLKARRGELEDPALAYRCMLLVGAEITGVELSGDGSLDIETGDNEAINIKGQDEVWEESWILSEPREVVGNNARFVICDSHGAVSSG